MFVFCEEYYCECEKFVDYELDKMVIWQQIMEFCYGKVEVIIGKQCYGFIGMVELFFEG